MVATYQDLVVEQGATFEFTVDLLDQDTGDPRTDLTGWTGTMKIRQEQSSVSTLLATVSWNEHLVLV